MSKILIVDDEPPVSDILSYNLKQAGYEVVIACDGEQAVERALAAVGAERAAERIGQRSATQRRRADQPGADRSAGRGAGEV